MAECEGAEQMGKCARRTDIANVPQRLYCMGMADDPDQIARDEWQTALYEASYRFSVSLKQLHQTNPWPEVAVIDQAINTLATELWDRCFGVTEIVSAFTDAAADLPRYAAGDEVRP